MIKARFNSDFYHLLRFWHNAQLKEWHYIVRNNQGVNSSHYDLKRFHPLLETEIPTITKVIAQKDIRFSNSPVEAVNKIVKGYLRFYKPSTYEDVIKCLELIEKDYNYKWPYGSLAGLRPMETYKEPGKILDFSVEKRTAKGLRIVENQKANCSCLRH